ncbi:MAG: cytochrome c oxidase subunit 3 family protein [Bacteroidota bacterium]
MASPAPTTADPNAHEAHGHDGDGHHGDGHHGDVMLRGHDGQLHPANLQHHFISAEQQFESAKLGMWLFLVTEILLFGGMFVAYAIYRSWYPDLFDQASLELDTAWGAFNTLVLLGSSLSVAWAIRAAQMDNRKLLVRLLWLTVMLAGVFMVVKYFEYTHKFEKGIFPGQYFKLAEGTPTIAELTAGTAVLPGFADATAEGAESEAATPSLEETEAAIAEAAGEHGETHAGEKGHGEKGPIFSNPRAGIFFSIYYVMTGIHGLHVIIGIIAISILAVKAQRGRYSSVYYTPVENVGLYWHVVDIIWIFLFPLMYLI